MTVFANLAHERATWLSLPTVFPRIAPDAQTWGRELSLACWSDSGLAFRQEEVDRLAAVLTKFVAELGPGAVHPEHEFDPKMEIQTLLHLRDPQAIPFPVRVMVFHESVVRAEKVTVEDLVQVDDAEAIDAPEVVAFEHPNLGKGLRAFRHRTAQGDDGPSTGIYAVLKYAFTIPGHEELLLVSLSWPDLARIAEARDDIDDLVRSITVEDYPDPAPEANVGT